MHFYKEQQESLFVRIAIWALSSVSKFTTFLVIVAGIFVGTWYGATVYYKYKSNGSKQHAERPRNAGLSNAS